jgi:hypothetical protein
MSPAESEARTDDDITDALRARLHLEWQHRITDALRQRAWQSPRHQASGGPVSWEEVASLAVEALWNDIEPIVRPVVGLLAETSSRLTAPSAESPLRSEPTRSVDEPADRQRLWLSAEETAPLLNTTAHTLRRLAREERCPVLVRRIGGRWRFARLDVERFVAR